MQNTYFELLPQELFKIIFVKLSSTSAVYKFISAFNLSGRYRQVNLKSNQYFKILCNNLCLELSKFPDNIIFEDRKISWRNIYEDILEIISRSDLYDDFCNQKFKLYERSWRSRELFVLVLYEYYINNTNIQLFEILLELLREKGIIDKDTCEIPPEFILYEKLILDINVKYKEHKDKMFKNLKLLPGVTNRYYKDYKYYDTDGYLVAYYNKFQFYCHGIMKDDVVIERLTDKEKEIAINKGYTICSKLNNIK